MLDTVNAAKMGNVVAPSLVPHLDSASVMIYAMQLMIAVKILPQSTAHGEVTTSTIYTSIGSWFIGTFY